MSQSAENKIDLLERIDRNINTIFRTARIRIERTKTSKEALKIEELYLPKIRKVFKNIIKDYEGKIHYLHEAEKRYGTEVQSLIKSMVTRTYLLGMEYVSRSTNRPQYMFMSPSDLTQIMIQSDESYRMFWRLVTKHLQVLKNKTFINKTAAVRHQRPNMTNNNVTITDEIFAMEDEEDDRLINIDTNAALITSGIVATTLAFATLQKYREFKQQTQEIREFLDTNEDDPFTDIGDYELGEGGGKQGDTVVFATEQDASVCPTCSQLEGLEWDLDDPSIIVPESDTHPNCRCRLLLKINGNIIAK